MDKPKDRSLHQHPDARRWDERYAQKEASASACALLHDYHYLLPPQGEALDLACGLGGNALLLAEQGLNTHAWDISANALTQLQQQAQTRGLVVHTEHRDVIASPPAATSFDVIIVSRFLHRPLIPALIEALRPQGLVFYQTFITDTVDNSGPSSPGYRLYTNELLQLFAPLTVRHYHEAGRCGDLQQGLRNEAMIIAQKIES